MGKLHKIPTAGLTKEEWLALRSPTIGGSEMGTILGLNPYDSAYSLWCVRTGRMPAFEGNAATELGTALEPVVAKFFCDDSGLKVEKTNFIYRNDDYPILHASPDRLVKPKKGCTWSQSCGLEIKTTNTFSIGKLRGVEFPTQYYAQCVQYMMVTERRNWFLAVMDRGTGKKLYYQLTTDPAIEKAPFVESLLFVPRSEFDALYKAAEEFMEMVQKDTPPEPDGSDKTGKTISKVFEDAIPGTAYLYDQDGLIAEYMQAAEAVKSAEDKKTAIENQLKLKMEGHEEGDSSFFRLKWKYRDGRTSFDSKTALKDHPQLACYQKTGKPYRVFEVKPK